MNWSQPTLHLFEKPPNLINGQPIAGQQAVHDRITEKVIKRRLGSSGIHDNLQNGIIGFWNPSRDVHAGGSWGYADQGGRRVIRWPKLSCEGTRFTSGS
jgi:hypothetical protein